MRDFDVSTRILTGAGACQSVMDTYCSSTNPICERGTARKERTRWGCFETNPRGAVGRKCFSRSVQPQMVLELCLAELSQLPTPSLTPALSDQDLALNLTVLVTASLIPSHPDTAFIRRSLQSLQLLSLPAATPVLLSHDRPSGRELPVRFSSYLDRLRLFLPGFAAATRLAPRVLLSPTNGHLLGNIAFALSHVPPGRSKFLLKFEHDVEVLNGDSNRLPCVRPWSAVFDVDLRAPTACPHAARSSSSTSIFHLLLPIWRKARDGFATCASTTTLTRSTALATEATSANQSTTGSCLPTSRRRVIGIRTRGPSASRTWRISRRPHYMQTSFSPPLSGEASLALGLSATCSHSSRCGTKSTAHTITGQSDLLPRSLTTTPPKRSACRAQRAPMARCLRCSGRRPRLTFVRTCASGGSRPLRNGGGATGYWTPGSAWASAESGGQSGGQPREHPT